MTTTITPMQLVLMTRYNKLTAKVEAEERNLSAFRQNEAFDLALTKEEQSDLSFLCRIRGNFPKTEGRV